MSVDTSEIERRIGYAFADRALLAAALTHRSWAHESGGGDHYERLEFLGDAVLGLVTAEWLYRRFADHPEGELSRWKARLVSAPALAPYAETLGLGERLRLGVGEDRSGGRTKASLLADALEALWGAVYLDGGHAAARAAIVAYLERATPGLETTLRRDAKTELQELAQGRAWELPLYRVVQEVGPEHDKRFVVEVELRGAIAGRGVGRSKKGAEQEAALAALAAIPAAGSDGDATTVAGGEFPT